METQRRKQLDHVQASADSDPDPYSRGSQSNAREHFLSNRHHANGTTTAPHRRITTGNSSRPTTASHTANQQPNTRREASRGITIMTQPRHDRAPTKTMRTSTRRFAYKPNESFYNSTELKDLEVTNKHRQSFHSRPSLDFLGWGSRVG